MEKQNEKVELVYVVQCYQNVIGVFAFVEAAKKCYDECLAKGRLCQLSSFELKR